MREEPGAAIAAGNQPENRNKRRDKRKDQQREAEVERPLGTIRPLASVRARIDGSAIGIVE